MIQAGVIRHLQNRMDGASLRVIGSVHQAAEAGIRIKLNVLPSEPAADADFLRRVYLDVVGTLPTPA